MGFQNCHLLAYQISLANLVCWQPQTKYHSVKITPAVMTLALRIVCVFWESSCHIINHSCLMPCLNFRWRWSLQDLPGTAWHSHHWTASSQFSQSCFGGSQCSNGPSAQTCNNVQRVATCTDCQKPWVLYAARKVPLKDLQNLAKLLDVRCCPAVTGDWWWQHSHRQWPVVTHIWSC